MIVEQTVEFSTLSDLLEARAGESGRGISFILGKEEEVFRSYRDVYAKALCVLGYLQSKGVRQGDLLIFQLPENHEFIHVFWACMIGGIAAVPLAADHNDESFRKLHNVRSLMAEAFVIGSRRSIEGFEHFARKENGEMFREPKIIDIDQAILHEISGKPHDPAPGDTAFVQFSSGSTGKPKGVVLTHENLMTNIRAIVRGARLSASDVIVSWMPLTHDMGLIGCHLAVLAADMNQCTMTTALFVRRPALWLEKASQHGATILASPNFGLKYAMMGLRRNRGATYDFSPVRLIFNGAEPISIRICEQFLDRMAEFGMKPDVMFPVYGMAEASLAITFPPLDDTRIGRVVVDRRSLKMGEPVAYLFDEEEEQAVVYADEGFPVDSCEVRICDEQDRMLPESALGMIHIRGGNVTAGYYGNPDADRAAYADDGWFRTGDIGFFRQSRLVVVGRTQEMVIVNGQNYFSNDLERLASEIDGVELNKVAVSSVIDRNSQTEQLIAFVVHRGEPGLFVPTKKKVREHFARSLGIRIDHIVPVAQIPKTSSGKLMRHELKGQFEQGRFDDAIAQCRKLLREEGRAEKRSEGQERRTRMEHTLLELCGQVLPEHEIGIFDNFFEQGIHSLALHQLAALLNERYPNSVTPEDLLAYPSVNRLAAYLCEENDEEAQSEPTAYSREPDANARIAIIGMSVRLPGADRLEEFWSNLCGGVESVGPLPSERRRDLDSYLRSAGLAEDAKVRHGGYLHDIDAFDYGFFRILKKEAIAMPPAQRLFMQSAYASLEDAGYGGDALRSSKTGVYVGYISDLEGAQYQEILNRSLDERSATGTLSANISGRFSYYMDFTGPSLLIDSACSSSMSALNAACQAIRAGDCEQAVVGGVQIKALPIAEKGVGIESSDGHTRPFSEDADGTGEGEGVIAVLIKPYERALADGDAVYSVIRASHTNQDGHSAGLSAPNPRAQTALIRETLAKADLKASDIGYVEAHGTGTRVGDPAELKALAKAFDQDNVPARQCAIGSVKSNIGHLYAASGLASLVKSSLMLQRKRIPATVNVSKPTSSFDWEDSPFYVNLALRSWDSDNVRRCAISNFGFSGTNCHVVLEEHIELAPIDLSDLTDLRDKAWPFVLSASSREGLTALVREYAEFLSAQPSLRLADICRTASAGRGHHAYRLALHVRTTDELIDKLERFHYGMRPSEGRYVGTIRKARGGADHARAASELDQIGEIGRISAACAEEASKTSNQHERDRLIVRLCNHYVQGAKPDWMPLFRAAGARSVHLPTYPFARSRCWPEFATEESPTLMTR